VDFAADVVSAAGVEDVAGAAGDVGVEEPDELEEPELPQPAATSATSATLSAASRRIPLFLVFSAVAIAIDGSFRYLSLSRSPPLCRRTREAALRSPTEV
jgi:hypothetical protein